MKQFIITVIIFLVVFAVVYFFVTGGFARLQEKVDPTPQEKTQQELMRELLDKNFGISPYWLERYGIAVTSEEDLQDDADEDGLTLVQEYEYLTNPFDPDTDKDGYTDGGEVFRGYSPTGEGELDVDANGLPDQWEKDNSLSGVDAQEDTDGDGLPNVQEALYGTNPNEADTDADGYDDGTEVNHGYDPTAGGPARPTVTVTIDRVGVEAPVILANSADEAELQKDLEQGVIHYPDMAMPGQRGNVYIAGHSSNYAWSRGSYNTIFKDLNQLHPDDVIRVNTTYSNSKTIAYTYTVTEQREAAADDPEIFADTQSEILTLTTCWPLGTADRRILVKAQRTE